MQVFNGGALAAAVFMAGLGLTLGCDEDEAAPAATAQPPEPPPPLPTPSAAPAPEPEAKSERPATIDIELTAARRSAVEAKYSEAAGFLDGKELEEKLKANKTIKAKEAAVSAFDRSAKGKWVLFSGSMVNLTETGFDLGVVYTPQMANDPMGMSRQFFEVTFSEVEGYKKMLFKAGNKVVVLAQYQGGGKAGPGYELVATEVWK